jgi:hypothetical protein
LVQEDLSKIKANIQGTLAGGDKKRFFLSFPNPGGRIVTNPTLAMFPDPG